jgi:predicted nucleotide-binding protein (sugar kinase/HSP70/actin superfamily)
LAGEADALFMPRLISVDPRGIMCPRFSGVPDIVRMVVGSGCRMFAPTIDAREGQGAVHNAYLAVAAEMGASVGRARRALREADAVQKRLDTEFEQRLNRLPAPDVFAPETAVSPPAGDARGAVRIAILGHPYVAYDWEFNLGLVEKLRSLGAWVVPIESIETKRTERLVRRLDKNVYWTSGRDIVGAALAFFEDAGRDRAARRHEDRIDGVVYLSCFKCGVDGLLSEVVRWASRHQSQVAYLPLSLDGHDNEVGLMTRLEAFLDIVQGRVKASRMSPQAPVAADDE